MKDSQETTNSTKSNTTNAIKNFKWPFPAQDVKCLKHVNIGGIFAITNGYVMALSKLPFDSRSYEDMNISWISSGADIVFGGRFTPLINVDKEKFCKKINSTNNSKPWAIKDAKGEAISFVNPNFLKTLLDHSGETGLYCLYGTPYNGVFLKSKQEGVCFLILPAKVPDEEQDGMDVIPIVGGPEEEKTIKKKTTGKKEPPTTATSYPDLEGREDESESRNDSRSHVGEKVIIGDGTVAEIIRFDGTHNLTVRFEDGHTEQGVRLTNLKSRKSQIPYRYRGIMQVGERITLDDGSVAEITGYRSVSDLDARFEDGHEENNISYIEMKARKAHKPAAVSIPEEALKIKLDPEPGAEAEATLEHKYSSERTAKAAATVISKAKEKALDMVVKANNGQWMTITGYANANDVTVTFEDGTVVEHKRMQHFKDGNITNPNYDESKSVKKEYKKKYENMIVRANNGQEMKCVKYRKYDDIDVMFADGTVVKHQSVGNFLTGRIKNPNFIPKMSFGEEKKTRAKSTKKAPTAKQKDKGFALVSDDPAPLSTEIPAPDKGSEEKATEEPKEVAEGQAENVVKIADESEKPKKRTLWDIMKGLMGISKTA